MKEVRHPSLGDLSTPLVGALVAAAPALRLGVERNRAGAVIVDAGIAVAGGLEGGRRIAEICMGGLGSVSLGAGSPFERWPFRVGVHTAQPVLACLCGQYAGWSLSHGDYFAMASGPGRATAAVEDIYGELGYRDDAARPVLVLEAGTTPPDALIDEVATKCRVAADALTFILTPTSSLAGTVQIVARVLEVAVHKVHALHFPLERLRDGLGTAPLPPPSPDFLTAMGRTNDAILFGGQVQLFVTGPDDDARELTTNLPSSSSRDFGKPFAQVFADAGNDFYKIDPMLFSPAEVMVTAIDSGRTFRGGRLAPELLERSFGDG